MKQFTSNRTKGMRAAFHHHTNINFTVTSNNYFKNLLQQKSPGYTTSGQQEKRTIPVISQIKQPSTSILYLCLNMSPGNYVSPKQIHSLCSLIIFYIMHSNTITFTFSYALFIYTLHIYIFLGLLCKT